MVVLSPKFFAKPWPQYELDGLLQRAMSEEGRILPIWHRLTRDDILRHAPSLANLLALDTATYTTDGIVAELVSMRDQYARRDGEREDGDAAYPVD